jgi:hypothetical protein
VWVAGLTADLPRLPPSCEGMRRGSGADEGVPPCGGPLSPCRHEWSGEPRPRKNTPCGGLAVLRALDDYLMKLDDFSDALSHHIPGQGRPPGLSGGCASRGEWRGVQGSPGGEGAERDSLDTLSHRIPGPIWDGETISDEPDDIRKPQKRSENYDDSDNPTAPITLTG